MVSAPRNGGAVIVVPVELPGPPLRRGRRGRRPPGAVPRCSAALGDARGWRSSPSRRCVEAGWLDGLDPGVPFDVHLLAEGEGAKSLATVEELCRAFAQAGLSRADVGGGVGGGVVTDVAGFAAAVLPPRASRYVNVATTLLAQVDAAIGGKTGVNLPEGKNLVGAFWQPAAVLCDTETLSHAPAARVALWPRRDGQVRLLGRRAARRVAPASSTSTSRWPGAPRSRRRWWRRTRRESGGRMVLNYGHTLAHALEADAFDEAAATSRHGEAVAIGLVFAALLARRLGRIDDDRVALHRRVVAGFDLRGRAPGRRPTRPGWSRRWPGTRRPATTSPSSSTAREGVEPVHRGGRGARSLATLAEMGAPR